MTLREVDQAYLEILIEAYPVRLKLLDGHGTSKVFTIPHFRETAAVLNISDVQKLLLKNIRTRYNLLGFTYF